MKKKPTKRTTKKKRATSRPSSVGRKATAPKSRPPQSKAPEVAAAGDSPPTTPDQLLWEVIKDRTEALSFRRYTDYIDRAMVDASAPTKPSARRKKRAAKKSKR
jgi:hypothetical protein